MLIRVHAVPKFRLRPFATAERVLDSSKNRKISSDTTNQRFRRDICIRLTFVISVPLPFTASLARSDIPGPRVVAMQESINNEVLRRRVDAE